MLLLAKFHHGSVGEIVMLIQYVRHPHNKHKLVGCVLSILNDENEVVFGWSQCNPLDQFSKQLAVEIAMGRALRNRSNKRPRKYLVYRPDGSTYKVDPFQERMDFMGERANKYFQGACYA